MAAEQEILAPLMLQGVERALMIHKEFVTLPHPLHPGREITLADCGLGQTEEMQRLFFTDPSMVAALEMFESQHTDADEVRKRLREPKFHHARYKDKFDAYTKSIEQGKQFGGFIISRVEMEESIHRRGKKAGQLKMTIVSETPDGQLTLRTPIYVIDTTVQKSSHPIKGFFIAGVMQYLTS